MNKHQKLIKGIEVFYKLALFGDRSSFLKSLSQEPLPFDWEKNPLPDTTIDADELTQPTEENGVLIYPKDQADHIQGKRPGQTPQFKFDQKVHYAQEMLNTLGFEPELKVDGFLGDETQKALDWYKGKSGVSGTNEVAVDMLGKLNQNTALAQRAKYRLDKNTFLNA